MVIIPSYTCYSVPASVIKSGLKVRIVDIDLDNLGMDLKGLEKIEMQNVLATLTVLMQDHRRVDRAAVMKLLSADGDRYHLHLGRAEKAVFFGLLKKYPLIPLAHHRLTQDAAAGDPANQALLEEAMSARRGEWQIPPRPQPPTISSQARGRALGTNPLGTGFIRNWCALERH